MCSSLQHWKVIGGRLLNPTNRPQCHKKIRFQEERLIHCVVTLLGWPACPQSNLNFITQKYELLIDWFLKQDSLINYAIEVKKSKAVHQNIIFNIMNPNNPSKKLKKIVWTLY